jgi:hypothetical protein
MIKSMKPQLPKPKKNLKSFILEEDAKLIDKTAIRIASTLTLLAIGITQIDDANAGGSKPSHNNHTNHGNDIYHEGDYTQAKAGATQDEELGNDGNEIVEKTYAGGMEVNPKEVASSHSNHYNHENSSEAGGK